jgi:LysR family transcriptional regulator for bpeEF and oprC
MGVACVLDIYAAPQLATGVLVRAYPQWSMRGRTFYMVTTRDRANSAKVRAFAEFLLEVLDPARRPSLHSSVPVKRVRTRKSL